jgi:hypothetical protein
VPQGFAWSTEWGSQRYTANAALVGQIYALYRKDDRVTGRNTCFAMKQLRFMAGDGGRSMIVGTGINPPCRPHHRGASCPPAPAACDCGALYAQRCNPHTLFGALVGGPGKDGSYQDVRSDYKKNEVALDYNAGFSGAMAGLLETPWTWQQCVSAGLTNAAQAAEARAAVLAALAAALAALLLQL